MNLRLSLATVAAAIAVIAGAALWISRPSGPDTNPVVAASPSPAPTSTTLTASPTPVAASPTPLTASPTASAVGGNATDVAAGYGFTCAITGSGGVKCWGDNTFGQLGNGTTTDSWTPVDVSGLTSGVSAIGVGAFHTCALTRQGGVQCWGKNDVGELGASTSQIVSGPEGPVFASNVPVHVSGLASGVTAIATGAAMNCALTTDGGIKCWGWNAYGQLGNGQGGAPGGSGGIAYETTPVDVAGLIAGVTAIAAGGEHACAVTGAGEIKCWGHNAWGQLGDGSTTSSFSPVEVTGLTSRVTSIAAGDLHTCALLQSGGVTCWGDNRDGQLGDGTETYRKSPVDVIGLATGVTAIGAGHSYGPPIGFHTCALMAHGGVKCWGLNEAGQLGDGTTTDSSIPVDVSGLATGVTAISAGAGHTCALTATGAVMCWGSNDTGQLGDGTTTDSSTPVVVSGL